MIAGAVQRVLDAAAAATEAAAMQWHNVTVEGWLELGPVIITTRAWVMQQSQNAMDMGRDYGRSEVGAPPTRHRHLQST